MIKIIITISSIMFFGYLFINNNTLNLTSISDSQFNDTQFKELLFFNYPY
jgi:hypothetical protein